MKKKTYVDKLEIYFWEGHNDGQGKELVLYRAELARNNYMTYIIGTPSHIRSQLKKRLFGYEPIPKISWKTILGNDEDGGKGFKHILVHTK